MWLQCAELAQVPRGIDIECKRGCVDDRAAHAELLRRDRDGARSCWDRTRSRTRRAYPGKPRWSLACRGLARERRCRSMKRQPGGADLPHAAAEDRRPPSASAWRPGHSRRVVRVAVPGSIHRVRARRARAHRMRSHARALPRTGSPRAFASVLGTPRLARACAREATRRARSVAPGPAPDARRLLPSRKDLTGTTSHTLMPGFPLQSAR